MELLKFHGIPWNFYSRCGDSMEFHGIWCWHQVPWNFQSSMEFHGTSFLTWKSSMEFHGIPWNFWRVPWNSMELWNIDINKFHNWGSVFHCFLYDFMSLYIRQSISSWNIEIFQFQSNFLVPLILVKWRYSILNGGLFITFCHVYVRPIICEQPPNWLYKYIIMSSTYCVHIGLYVICWTIKSRKVTSAKSTKPSMFSKCV